MHTRPIYARCVPQEFEEMWYSFALQLAREHIMRQVVTVILCLGVVLQKDLEVMPRALCRVGVDPVCGSTKQKLWLTVRCV